MVKMVDYTPKTTSKLTTDQSAVMKIGFSPRSISIPAMESMKTSNAAYVYSSLSWQDCPEKDHRQVRC